MTSGRLKAVPAKEWMTPDVEQHGVDVDDHQAMPFVKDANLLVGKRSLTG
jgi:hypothetical protein